MTGIRDADPLIRTKLRPPYIRRGLVPRPRLRQQIAHGLRGPLTLTTAPASFGKTTLLGHCLADDRRPLAWLALDKHDNQSGRFLRHLIAALQDANADLGHETAHLMTAVQDPPLDAVLTTLINELEDRAEEMVLVLDDLHLINKTPVQQAVAFLVAHCPRILHLALASRSDPPLPLTRLRARGQLVELQAADLRFTRAGTVPAVSPPIPSQSVPSTSWPVQLPRSANMAAASRIVTVIQTI
ncbi:MAG: hypothetical protein R3300_11600 [Candidatus Promineifilaceae bacterium]|nr:hypothetical protein [Candidatus Promineifilaceae bacterium]